MLADARELQLQVLRQRGRGPRPLRQCAGDRQPLGVGQRAQDLVGGLGHVGSYPYHARVELTDPQRRTLEQLIGTDPRPTFPADLAQRLRDRIEEAVRELELRDTLWLGKEKLTDHGRCEGKFASAISGEAPPFEHSPKSAAGVLLHRAVEVEVGARDGLDAHDDRGDRRGPARGARGPVRRVLARPGGRPTETTC